MNKKAQRTAVGISDIVSYIVFAMGVIIIILLFSLRSCVSEDIQNNIVRSNVVNSDSFFTTSNLIRTPIIIDLNKEEPSMPVRLEKMTLGDLIVLYKSDSDYENILEKQLSSIFSARYDSCVVFCIDERKFTYNDCMFFSTDCNEEGTYSQIIPDYHGNPIKVSLNSYPESFEGGDSDV